MWSSMQSFAALVKKWVYRNHHEISVPQCSPVDWFLNERLGSFQAFWLSFAWLLWPHYWSTVKLPLLWDFLGILGWGSPGCSLVKDSGSFSDFLNSSVCNTHIFPRYQGASFTTSVSKGETVIRGLPLVEELYLTGHKGNLCLPYFVLWAELEPYL